MYSVDKFEKVSINYAAVSTMFQPDLNEFSFFKIASFRFFSAIRFHEIKEINWNKHSLKFLVFKTFELSKHLNSSK